MSSNGKHTVYIDIDDEITAIIDKVKSAPDKIVALVLPKRATVLQSIVNMKLLKKSAHTAKKSLVLITSEAGLMPLAGAVGLHVAKTLQSKPEIPSPPDHDNLDEPEISEVEDEDEPRLDKTKSVGALAAAVSAKKDEEDETETIELDDMQVDNEDDEPASKSKKVRGFKIPNFDRFRLSFFLVILGVILLVTGWVFAAIILPVATVVIKTDTTTVTSDITFSVNTTYKEFNLAQAQVPVALKEVKKTDTQKATATGKKENGAKATGTVTLSVACASVGGTPPTVPAGTGISANGLTFITDNATSLTTPSFSPCKFYGSTTVTAQSPGTQYNLESGQTFSVNGFSSVSGNNGAAMTGGTTDIVTVLTQGDVDVASTVMKGRQDAAAAKDLAAQLQADGLRALDETKVVSDPVITSTPVVGTEAPAEVTVTAVTAYDVLGIKQDYLTQLIKKDVSGKIDTKKQSILDDGLGAATIHVTTRKSPTEAQMSLHSLVVAGAQLDVNAIKDQIRGMKRGDAENLISAKPGVKDVTISLKPFWVLSIPKATKKITINVEKPLVVKAQGTPSTNDSNP